MSHPLLADYPVSVAVPIQWADLDAYGHVNNTVFFRLFESARIEYLDRCGFLASYDHDRIGAILHSTHCRFRHPLHYPEEVVVGGRATDVQDDRFEMAYAIVSRTHDHIAGEGGGIVVSYDYQHRRKVPIPAEVRAAIERLES